ncbi:ion transporter [Novipirellula artificiosorum]|uniref:Cyclic nucleotide-gated potassium channel n=1 Tax=Novipirellula artificiosorum TaxID=2528016 RepID=A0A5C6DAG5_9BACT|nr:ion transporter [Novipirellula artificiosorum]TWU33890.1 Cyclic nucleotide-gated potassium channel [Novipirellula artificiosorum]
MNLRELVEANDTKVGRTFDLFIQALIVVSIVTFSLETLPGISFRQREILGIIETVCVLIFTAEYLARLFVADRKLQFATSFFGVIDLLAILPFYLSLGVDLRSIRAFRLLRLFRILKLARYSKAIRRFHHALLIAREEVVLFGFTALIVLYLAAVGIYYFENEAQPDAFASVFHSLWWAVATLTTVGYGDVYPITAGGRCFTFLVLLVGLGIVSVPAGLVSAALTKAREIEDQESVDSETR